MVLPVFFILNAGRIFQIAVGAGTALARFIAENPKIIGTTLSLEAISSVILSHEATEKEKIAIVDEIGKENPQLKYDILKNMLILPPPPALLLFHHSSFSESLKYLMIMIHRTQSKKTKHANKSFAKQKPNTK